MTNELHKWSGFAESAPLDAIISRLTQKARSQLMTSGRRSGGPCDHSRCRRREQCISRHRAEAKQQLTIHYCNLLSSGLYRRRRDGSSLSVPNSCQSSECWVGSRASHCPRHCVKNAFTADRELERRYLVPHPAPKAKHIRFCSKV
jgi:hypothetical protein